MKLFDTLTAILMTSLVSSSANAHMWLRAPVSRGGLNSIGGTSAQCNGLNPNSGTRTAYEAGQNVTFQFRVNQHGPGPFAFRFSESGDNFDTVLKANIPNQVTAGPDGFNGVNVQVTIPDTTCDTCSIQLSGMAQNDGTSKWYNCADIRIGAVGSLGLSFPSAVSPLSAPTSGGTQVIITGTGFGATSSSNLKCAFDSTIVSATWISSTQVSCTVPPRNAPSTAALEVSINGGTSFSSTGTVFTYNGASILPVITNVEPTVVTTGETITITGSNLFSSDVACKFFDDENSVTVPATSTSSTQVKCVVPQGVKGNIGVEISVDNSPYSQSGRSLSMNGASSLTFSAGVLLLALLLSLLVVF